ncbi:MAG: methyltransferase family protein [Elusimicrobiota bacterium]
MGRRRVFLGFAAAVLFAVFSHPASWSRLWAGVALALAGLLLRARAAGYLEKGKRLAQDGPYLYIRHPLYAGSFLMALGFCAAGTGGRALSHDLLIWATFFLLFFWVYPRRVREEEGSLEKYFGDAWRAFVKVRPRFLPRLNAKPRPDRDRFLWARYRKNREYNAALGWLFGALFLAAKSFVELP